jgi:hypothetical protein
MIEHWRRRLSRLPDEFVLNQEGRPPFDEWVTEAVGDFYLHTHPLTKIHRFPGAGGDTLVIGTIVAAPNVPPSAESCPPGQYVALSPTNVFSDSGSLKQAFFDRSAKTAASSLRLFAPHSRPVAPELFHGSRPDWYWGPRTSFEDIDFLLPSQQLDLQTFEPQFRQLPDPSGAPIGDPTAFLGDELGETFRHLARSGGPVRLAMTGGMDSRTLFAAAIKSGIPFETYTMVSRHVHSSDVAIARDISGRFGIAHQVLRVERIEADELDWYFWYSAGQSVGVDADFHAAGLWRDAGPGTIHVRGYGFELGRHKYRDFLRAEDEALIRSDPIQLWRKFTRPWVRPLHRYNRRAFESYMGWLSQTLDRSNLDFRDRLYLEQGIGSWCASSEYALGATGARRISIANDSRLYDLFVREDGSSKKSGALQCAMIRMVDPGLLEFDFVKPSRAERLRYRVLDTARALRVRRRLQRLR